MAGLGSTVWRVGWVKFLKALWGEKPGPGGEQALMRNGDGRGGIRAQKELAMKRMVWVMALALGGAFIGCDRNNNATDNTGDATTTTEPKTRTPQSEGPTAGPTGSPTTTPSVTGSPATMPGASDRAAGDATDRAKATTQPAR